MDANISSFQDSVVCQDQVEDIKIDNRQEGEPAANESLPFPIGYCKDGSKIYEIHCTKNGHCGRPDFPTRWILRTRELITQLGYKEFLRSQLPPGRISCSDYVYLIFKLGEAATPRISYGVMTSPSGKALRSLLGTLMKQVRHSRNRVRTTREPEEVASLIQSAHNIVVISGPSVDTTVGVPNYLSKEFLKEEVQNATDYEEFREVIDVQHFPFVAQKVFKFLPHLYPKNYSIPKVYDLIEYLAENKKLQRCYTQSILTLRNRLDEVFPEHMVEVYGSITRAICYSCDQKIPSSIITPKILNQDYPWCRDCLKARKARLGPNYTEPVYPECAFRLDIDTHGKITLPEIENVARFDQMKCDLLIVAGMEADGSWVTQMPLGMPGVPHIYIDTEIKPFHDTGDIALIGGFDTVFNSLIQALKSGEASESKLRTVPSWKRDGEFKNIFHWKGRKKVVEEKPVVRTLSLIRRSKLKRKRRPS